MSNVRLAAIFHGTFGTNHQMVEVAADAAREVGGVATRAVRAFGDSLGPVWPQGQPIRHQASRLAHFAARMST